MKKLVPWLAMLTLVGCSRGSEDPQVSVKDAVVTVPAVPGGMGGLYFTLESNREGSRLVSVASPSVRSIELHETRMEGGRSKMAPLGADGAAFGPDAPLRFEPGGKHGMLMGVDSSVQPGGKVTLTFQVEPVGAVTVEADVRGPGQGRASE